ncbi:MAG: hypothetical protein IJJ82_03080 [Clostridia bacterium]|nr:hypothetical protein [Clostridia bacterium]
MNALLGGDGIITNTAKETFRAEMKELRSAVEIKKTEGKSYAEKLLENFEQVKISDIENWDTSLKFEIIYWGNYEFDLDVTELTREYVENNGMDIIENNSVITKGGVQYSKNLYYIDSKTGLGKSYTYLYDNKSDKLYKIPVTFIGPYRVHSVEELGYQIAHNTGESTTRTANQGTLIEDTSEIATVENLGYYAPDLKGFVKEKTKAIYYTTTNNEIDSAGLEVPISDYLSGEIGRTTKSNNKTYEFYNYENKIWANIKVQNGGIISYWVWIPRYAYKINGTAIDIIYTNLNDKKASDNTDLPDGYIPHPDFDGGKKGIWVSKYEVAHEVSSETADFPYYLPDLSGFKKETTYIEVYNSQTGDFKETPLAKIENIADFASKNTWFDYDKKIWANIKVLNNNQETWWVWIPRYAYNITGNEIKLIFIDTKDRPLSGEPLPSNYIVHPAFDNSKKGIWVSKYEVSNNVGTQAMTSQVNFPDLTGFDYNTTYMEIYKNNGFLEEKLSVINNINAFAIENKWFDYGNKKWANLKTMANGVECWWVWIPSYAYNITGEEIKIIFIDENGQPLDGSTLPANYIPHPAFTGKKGIWVSKYEPSQQ